MLFFFISFYNIKMSNIDKPKRKKLIRSNPHSCRRRSPASSVESAYGVPISSKIQSNQQFYQGCFEKNCPLKEKYIQKFPNFHCLLHNYQLQVLKRQKLGQDKKRLKRKIIQQQDIIKNLQFALKQQKATVKADLMELMDLLTSKQNQFDKELRNYAKMLNIEKNRNSKLSKKFYKNEKQLQKLQRLVLFYRDENELINQQNNYLREQIRNNSQQKVNLHNLSEDSRSQSSKKSINSRQKMEEGEMNEYEYSVTQMEQRDRHKGILLSLQGDWKKNKKNVRFVSDDESDSSATEMQPKSPNAQGRNRSISSDQLTEMLRYLLEPK